MHRARVSHRGCAPAPMGSLLLSRVLPFQTLPLHLLGQHFAPGHRSIDKARLAGATAAKRSRCRGQAGAPGLPSEPAVPGRRAGSGPVCFPRRLALLLGAKAGSSTVNVHVARDGHVLLSVTDTQTRLTNGCDWTYLIEISRFTAAEPRTAAARHAASVDLAVRRDVQPSSPSHMHGVPALFCGDLDRPDPPACASAWRE